MTTLAATSGPSRLVAAGMVSRGLAFTVDVLMLTGGLTAVLVVAGAVGAVLGWEPMTLVRGLAGIFASALPSLWVVLSAAMWRLTGRTPGKALFGLRVVRADGGPLGTGRAVLRACCYFLSAILLLGFLWVLVDRRRQAWHDKLTGTMVVYDHRPTARPVSG